MKLLIAFFCVALLGGCFVPERKTGVLMNDKDFVAFWRAPSPDGSRFLLSYGINGGRLRQQIPVGGPGKAVAAPN
ncbi:MAG: hypothetical protein EOO11_16670 [Chitinophagaceae bacterium]|nr:MAG: hypothetical protein EOO11_16670 [Chitinophagaceae bacterium]